MIDDILEKLLIARTKFPSNQHMALALVEEVGEVSQALIENQRGRQTHRQVYRECVQAAVMAKRVATEGDSTLIYDPELGQDFSSS